MTRLIDADKITYTPSVPIAVISRIVNTGREEDARHLFHVSRADIDAQPTIDAVPVRHGKWEPISEGVKGGHFECCVCKHPAFYAEDGVEELTMFCPNCGARMDEDAAEPKYDYCNGPYEERDSLESRVIKSALASETVYDPKGESDVSEWEMTWRVK